LLAGVVAWLRSVGRGRRRWEPATVLTLAALPVVWSCVGLYLHPQDLIALGFGLTAMACARRQWWASAGALVALAVLSQQFALLMAVPLLVLAPPSRRVRYLAGGGATAILLVAPLFVLSGGTVLRAITVGSGDNPSVGGTVMWELSHRGIAVVLISRLAPIVLAFVLTWWAVRRLGPKAFTPVAMMSIIATSLGLRLVLEQNIFEYYMMALAVTLILLEVTRGHIRGSVVTWLATVLLTFSLDGYFSFVTSDLHLEAVLPELVIMVGMALAAFGLASGRRWPPWNVMLWSCVVACALVTWSTRANPLFHILPTWLIQAVFVSTGCALAVTPLLEVVRGQESGVPGGVSRL
jgi:hypothetical protein